MLRGALLVAGASLAYPALFAVAPDAGNRGAARATASARCALAKAAALLGRPNLTGLVLGCIEAKFCK